MFESLFTAGAQFTVAKFLICLASAIVLGAVLCVSYRIRNRASDSFTVALCVLPAVICVVIMLVNGNIGVGVAVAGAFSLIRFRSAPGSAKELAAIFISVGAGLLLGMGFIGYAALFTVILCAVMVLVNCLRPCLRTATKERTLRVTIPEDLDYVSVFDGVFATYTTYHELVSTKTVNMGSMFRLTYEITLKDPVEEKAMIDEIRQKNGNLEVCLSRKEENNDRL